jgi:O-acetyl-ADP-ribose deacetylase (regulator of RNase III)
VAKPRVRYDALQSCLYELANVARDKEATVHMPRIGCGQAGGRWEVVSELIYDALCRHGITVTVYDLPYENRTEKPIQRSLF